MQALLNVHQQDTTQLGILAAFKRQTVKHHFGGSGGTL